MASLQCRLAIAASLAGLATHGLLAAEQASEQDYLQEFPVVLSASRLSQPLSEAPNAVTVIDREMIKASGFRTIADLFRLVPGMFVGNMNGHFPIVAYHGATEQYSRRMQVLVDGRSVYLPPFSSVNWEDIPLHIDDIERIEVVRGPAAASYGANSFQGVINIITRDAASVNGTTISATRGNGGISDASVHFGKTGADLDYRVTLGYRADNGYDTPLLNDDNATHLANLRANYRPSMTDSFDFQFGYNLGVRGEGGNPFGVPFANTDVHSDFEQITWLHALPQYDELKVSYYRINRYAKDRSFMPAVVDVDVFRHELEVQHTVHIGADNRLVWGGGLRADSSDAGSAGLFQMTQHLHQSRLFAHDEWRMTESAVVNGGAMVESDGMGHHNTSPRLSLNYHLTPQHTLRAGASVAYRSPATLEEAADIPGIYVSRGGLSPEKIYSREVGYLGELREIGTSVDVRAYYDRLTDFIFLDPDPTTVPLAYSFSNLLDTTYKGVEGTVKFRWAERSNAIFNYSRQYASCDVTGTPLSPAYLAKLQDAAASCSSMVPLNSGSILVTEQATENVQLSAGYYYQQTLQMLSTPAPLMVMHRIDLRAANTFGKAHEAGSGEVALVVQNAFRNDYDEYSATPQTTGQIIFHRRAFVKASLNF